MTFLGPVISVSPRGLVGGLSGGPRTGTPSPEGACLCVLCQVVGTVPVLLQGGSKGDRRAVHGRLQNGNDPSPGRVVRAGEGAVGGPVHARRTPWRTRHLRTAPPAQRAPACLPAPVAGSVEDPQPPRPRPATARPPQGLETCSPASVRAPQAPSPPWPGLSLSRQRPGSDPRPPPRRGPCRVGSAFSADTMCCVHYRTLGITCSGKFRSYI